MKFTDAREVKLGDDDACLVIRKDGSQEVIFPKKENYEDDDPAVVLLVAITALNTPPIRAACEKLIHVDKNQ